MLHTALLVLADQAYDDAHHLGDRLLPDAGPGTLEVLDRLPPLTWTADHRWRRRMARAFDDLAGDLADGHWPRPTCIAEEMALHLAVDDVPAHLEDLCEEDDHHTLPSHRDDYSHSHLLFRDQDVLMLFHTGFTGVGGPGRAAWFTPSTTAAPETPDGASAADREVPGPRRRTASRAHWLLRISSIRSARACVSATSRACAFFCSPSPSALNAGLKCGCSWVHQP